MNRSTIVHRTEDIERLLKRGLAPITDNAVVLQQMGFAHAYPTARNGYEASMYERSVDWGCRSTEDGLRRVLICQRAFLRLK